MRTLDSSLTHTSLRPEFMNLAISLRAESKWSKGSNRFIVAVHLNLSTSAVISSECLASRGWLANLYMKASRSKASSWTRSW